MDAVLGEQKAGGGWRKDGARSRSQDQVCMLLRRPASSVRAGESAVEGEMTTRLARPPATDSCSPPPTAQTRRTGLTRPHTAHDSTPRQPAACPRRYRGCVCVPSPTRTDIADSLHNSIRRARPLCGRTYLLKMQQALPRVICWCARDGKGPREATCRSSGPLSGLIGRIELPCQASPYSDARRLLLEALTAQSGC